MVSTLSIYREFASRPEKALSVGDLEARGCSRNHAHVILSRLRAEGLTERLGPGRVRLLDPEDTRSPQQRPDPLMAELEKRGAKATGFSVLPRRYPAPRPMEFVVPLGKAIDMEAFVSRHHPNRKVVLNAYEASERTVCLYSGRVRGRRARPEEALLHVYRHAPQPDFALALQALLHETTNLDWRWLRRQREWHELAGVFVALNSMAGRSVFPRFRSAEPPRLSFNALATAAQSLVARGAAGEP